MIRFVNRVLFTESDAYKAINDHNKAAEASQKQYKKGVASIEKNNWTRETKDTHIANLTKPLISVPIECLTVLWKSKSTKGIDSTGHSLWEAMLKNKTTRALYSADAWAEAIVEDLANKFYEMEAETKK